MALEQTHHIVRFAFTLSFTNAISGRTPNYCCFPFVQKQENYYNTVTNILETKEHVHPLLTANASQWPHTAFKSVNT